MAKKIIVDAMGGDKAPGEIVKGVCEAVKQFNVNIVLVGDKKKIDEEIAKENLSLDKIEIVDAPTAILMTDSPLSVIREKRDSSMATGLKLLKTDGDAFVSAGNTGALHTGASLILRSLKGIQRSAIAAVLPFEKPLLMMDCGANISVTSDYLVQWAIMGSIYMQKVFGIKNPRVGLLNNGTEEHKGTPVLVETYQRLSNLDIINFCGNIESREIPQAPCDVLITDGFTGNITLKLVEGMGKFMFTKLKDVYSADTASKLSFLAVKGNILKLKKTLDASEYGGAPLLGITKPVIKAHGSSDATAIKNAIKQAIRFAETNVTSTIDETLINLDTNILKKED